MSSTNNMSWLVLPDDLLLSCLARVSRSYYPTLSLVSKKFRSLLASPELYKVRSLLGLTENHLYVFLEFPPDPTPRLFTLRLKPNQTLTKDTGKKNKKSSGYVLIAISSPHQAQVDTFGLVAVGSYIYQIGGLINDKPSSRVSVLDCLSHTWHEGPKMKVARKNLAANVVDEKIYVVGGHKEVNSSNWMEVFDPKTQGWEAVLCPDAEMYKTEIINSKVEYGYICTWNCDNGVDYNPKDGTWKSQDLGMKWDMASYSFCMINDVLYCYADGKFRWFDTKLEELRILKGLEELQFVCLDERVKLVEYGGNIMVLWSNYVIKNGHESRRTECAEIALERCDNEEIVGKIEWSGVILETTMFCAVSSVCVVTV